MFTWALESSSRLGATVGTAPHSATNTITTTVLTASAPSMILFFYCREAATPDICSPAQALLRYKM